MHIIWIRKVATCILAIILAAGWCGCAPGTRALDQKGELWICELTGDALGEMKMYLDKSSSQEDLYTVSGKADILVVVEGLGTSRARVVLKGKVVDGVMKVKISGIGISDDGESRAVTGELMGTVSETEGFGEYKAVSGSRGTYVGKWTMKKAR
jgi:hypothetical protein